jgi:acyl carrier protein
LEKKREMEREETKTQIIKIFREQFEIKDPGLDEDLRELYEFDSIDAIELLREIEILLGTTLTRTEKKAAMEIRTINQILDYMERLSSTRTDELKRSHQSHL